MPGIAGDRIMGGEIRERIVTIAGKEYVHRTYQVGYLVMEHDHDNLEQGIREFYEEWHRQERAHMDCWRTMFEPVNPP